MGAIGQHMLDEVNVGYHQKPMVTQSGLPSSKPAHDLKLESFSRGKRNFQPCKDLENAWEVARPLA